MHMICKIYGKDAWVAAVKVKVISMRHSTSTFIDSPTQPNVRSDLVHDCAPGDMLLMFSQGRVKPWM